MPTYRFMQVDAFTARPIFGNPVAVVLGADGLKTEDMQRIATWTNLSETTFVLTPTVAPPAYRLRIFSPGHELPFAGHPTIGSCHAVLEAQIVTPQGGRLVQECGAGNLPLRVEGEGKRRRIHVEAPEARCEGEFPGLTGALTAALGRKFAATPAPTAFRNGPNWLFVRFEDTNDVTALEPDMSAVTNLSREHDLSGVAAFALVEHEFAAHPVLRAGAQGSGGPDNGQRQRGAPGLPRASRPARANGT